MSGGSAMFTPPGSNDMTKKGLPVFNSYMSLFQVQENLKKGEVIEGVLRINPKNYEDAYISAPGGGTDIYIGGVHDRNASLHGDVVAVELMDPIYWKVLYEQLDYLLDVDAELKKSIYAENDQFEVMDQFVPPAALGSQCPARLTDQQQRQGPLATTVNKPVHNVDNASTTTTAAATTTIPTTTASIPTASTTTATTTTTAAAVLNKNNKKKRRNNKKKNKNGAENDCLSGAAEEIVAGLITNPPVQNVQDELKIISADLTAATSKEIKKTKPDKNKKKAPVVIVPPELLSECSEVSDGESSSSDTLDADCTVEDRSFFKAQRKAAAKAAAAKTGTVDIVDITDNPAQVEKLQAEEEAAATKKRVSTAERLFGDKLKQKPTVKSNSKVDPDLKDSVSPKVEKLLSMMDISQKVEVPTKQEGGSNFQCKNEQSLVDGNPGTAMGSPRFMVSPYNQQVNFSPGQKRAENNFLNHPMLNNFSNAPPSQSNYQQSPNRPQNQQYGNINRQHQQHRNQQQQQPHAESKPKRTVPTVAQVMRLSNWGRYIQKVGYIVRIMEQRNTRLGAGILKPFADNNRQFALFSANDGRIPRMKIPMNQCPADLFVRRNDYAKKIYLAKITKWTDHKFALGELVRDIGRQGDIDAESEAFLLQIGIETEDFTPEVIADLPVVPSEGWQIPLQALEGRTDLRDVCIFSIDPATARDLDDALSCVPLPCGGFRVGVHIADVSYFVPCNTELDKCAADRATSVYLVNRVIPMLPRVLCEQLCSLNPNEDRLAFSVIWEMDRYGVIKSTWFGRTIINSCSKMSYGQAQSVLDNPQKTDWTAEELAPVSRFPLSLVCETILHLRGIAHHMRLRRHENGALRLDQNKLSFSLDPKTKLPDAVQTLETGESNHLIEEFMLLANISVAHKIHESFPKEAILRCHPEPQAGPIDDTAGLLRTFDIDIDTSSSASIYAGIQELKADENFSEESLEVVVNMLSKPMQTALYFCSGTYQEDFSHYALNVPFYTHFTSPIRRYPDVMVHRLLAAAIDPQRYPLVQLSEDIIDRRVSKANEKKMNAKRASEYSNELYLAEFVRQVREVITTGIVIGVLDRSLDLLLLEYCAIRRTYLEKLPLDELNFDTKNKNDPPTLHIMWKPDHQRQLPASSQSFTYFTKVKVILTPFTNDQLKFNVTLMRPDDDN